MRQDVQCGLAVHVLYLVSRSTHSRAGLLVCTRGNWHSKLVVFAEQGRMQNQALAATVAADFLLLAPFAGVPPTSPTGEQAQAASTVVAVPHHLSKHGCAHCNTAALAAQPSLLLHAHSLHSLCCPPAGAASQRPMPPTPPRWQPAAASLRGTLQKTAPLFSSLPAQACPLWVGSTTLSAPQTAAGCWRRRLCGATFRSRRQVRAAVVLRAAATAGWHMCTPDPFPATPSLACSGCSTDSTKLLTPCLSLASGPPRSVRKHATPTNNVRG